jgi:alpha-L-rhamnosidase
MEAWDPAIKPNTTFSHAWGTAPVNVAARWIAGIEIVEPGAARLRITPRPGGLDHFDCVVPTIRGPVRLAYRRDGAPLLVLDLPPNVEAELDCIPDALAGIDPHNLSLATAPTRVESGRLVATGLGPGHHILQRP